MPSVGMRRRTRVFGARVLRSGRRLWTEPDDGNKNGRGLHGDNKFDEHLDNWTDRREDVVVRNVDSWREIDNSISVSLHLDTVRAEGTSDEMGTSIDKMFGLVYSRKRKSIDWESLVPSEDLRFGKKFVRRDWKRRRRAIESFEIHRGLVDTADRFGELGIAINNQSSDSNLWVSYLLFTMLSYMTRTRVGIRRLCSLLLSKPLSDVYASLGIVFFKDAFVSRRPGVCIISGSRYSVPLLYLTSPAIPLFFMHMQTIVHFRCARLAQMLLLHEYEDVLELVADAEEPSSVSPEISSRRKLCRGEAGDDFMERWKSSQLSVGLSKNVVEIQSNKIQKRRSSLGRRKGITMSSEYPGMCVIGRPNNGFIENIKEVRFSDQMVSPSERSPTCCARLLVTETDKCYREEGITISLESSIPYCFLAIKKDGSTCYSLLPQKAMKPYSSNRFTHSIVWGETGDWKLEFLSKKDWMTFKELYKECFERNTMSHAATVIPVPRVQDVPYFENSYYVPFVRPDSYITVKNDEVFRTMENRRGNYDMDSDDERWLTKLNAEGTLQEMISPDSFELVISSLEKAYHCSPDETFDEQAGYEFCEHIASREVFKAIRKYWILKRKQKRAPLIRVFQLYQPRRSQVIPKSVLRKKRSFKRQGTHRVHDRQVPFFQEISGGRESTELQNIAKKVHGAAAAADGLEELAILNRHKAQILMVNADLSTYKALMALRIAEAAHLTDGMVALTSIFLAD